MSDQMRSLSTFNLDVSLALEPHSKLSKAFYSFSKTILCVLFRFFIFKYLTDINLLTKLYVFKARYRLIVCR